MTIFEWPFQVTLDAQNRWGKLSQWFPWDTFYEGSGVQSRVDPTGNTRIATRSRYREIRTMVHGAITATTSRLEFASRVSPGSVRG